MLSEPTFVIVHTAKDVEYNVNGFLTKNKDEMNPVVVKYLSESTNSLVKALYDKEEEKKDKFIA